MTTRDMRYGTAYRYGALYQYGTVPNKPYDYKTCGILRKVMPAFVLDCNNTVLRRFLRFMDAQFVNMTMTVEKLAKFKNYMSA